MKPYIFNELFETNTDLVGQIILTENDQKILLVDNFFKNFEEIRQTVLMSRPCDWKYSENTRNYIDYYDCRIYIHTLIKTNLVNVSADIILKQYEKDTEPTTELFVNWFKQITEKKNDYAWPHTDQYDSSKSLYTFLIFLNSETECSGGTAFFEQNTVDDNNEHLNYWGSNPNAWRKIGHLNMKPNRLIVFPSNLWHAAFHPENTFFDFPRLTMVYQMGEKCI